MKPFFNTQVRVTELEMSARNWQGTPFRHNSMVRQVGANCVGAIVGVLQEAGFSLPQTPQGPTNWSKHQTESLQAKWMDSHPELVAPIELKEDGNPLLSLEPGDVVGFQVGLCIHHLGLILPDGRFFQCSEAMGCVILSQFEPLFRKRLRRAWRPVEETL